MYYDASFLLALTLSFQNEGELKNQTTPSHYLSSECLRDCSGLLTVRVISFTVQSFVSAPRLRSDQYESDTNDSIGDETRRQSLNDGKGAKRDPFADDDKGARK